MKHFFIAACFFIAAGHCAGQTSYLENGNAQMNNGNFVAAEKIFSDAIKADSTNLVYKCQLALALMNQKKHAAAQKTIDAVLSADSTNIGAMWYAGMNNFLDQGADLRTAIKYFEKVMPLLKESQGQYFGANWFIGRSYQMLLQTNGLSYTETSRMLECYTTYLKLQPGADDAKQVAVFVQHIKDIRPPQNVKTWVNKQP